MNTSEKLPCFKAYDVRSKLGEDLNEKVAYRIGRATAQALEAKTVALGLDARESSPNLAKAVAKGICDAGANVLDIGLAGTEEVYSAVSEFKTDAGIQVTASHNPIDYNGMKLVKQGSRPLSEYDFGLVKQLAEINQFKEQGESGLVVDMKTQARNVYLEKIMSFVDLDKLKPLKIVINSGNGAAGPTLDALKKRLEEKGVKTNFFYVDHDPDSSFPNGIPNPLIKENRSLTANVVVDQEGDFGVAFDGDFDRCFLFDHLGNFISGEYLVGILAEVFLSKEAGASIIHDPRVIWNTMDVVNVCGGQAFASKTGHAYVKAAMREKGAIYGGEMSAHHYFRDFAYCDSGMVPWLLIWELLSHKNLSLNKLISGRESRFPSSGEINFIVSNVEYSIQKVKDFYIDVATNVDELDGLSMSFKDWRFNLRESNTEPLVRLNLETKIDKLFLQEKTKEVASLISGK